MILKEKTRNQILVVLKEKMRKLTMQSYLYKLQSELTLEL